MRKDFSSVATRLAEGLRASEVKKLNDMEEKT